MDGEPTREPGEGAGSPDPGRPGDHGHGGPMDIASDLASQWPPELFDDCERITLSLELEEDAVPGLWRHAWIPGRSPS